MGYKCNTSDFRGIVGGVICSDVARSDCRVCFRGAFVLCRRALCLCSLCRAWRSRPRHRVRLPRIRAPCGLWHPSALVVTVCALFYLYMYAICKYIFASAPLVLSIFALLFALLALHFGIPHPYTRACALSPPLLFHSHIGNFFGICPTMICYTPPHPYQIIFLEYIGAILCFPPLPYKLYFLEMPL